jgi:dephospho-CoA kinase
MITIGLTGPIAGGKSSVARHLRDLGAPVIDADRVAHEAYAPGTPGFDAVVAAFGPGVIAEDGTINRRALGQIVFGDRARLKQLTDIVWPLTGALLRQRRDEADAAGTPFLVIEAAVLSEAGWRNLVDHVWLVRAPREAILQRVQARDNLSLADAEARIAARTEMDPTAADLVIDNDGTLEDLHAAIDAAWAKLTGNV